MIVAAAGVSFFHKTHKSYAGRVVTRIETKGGAIWPDSVMNDNDVEEKIEKYFGNLVRCDEKFCI